MSPTHDLPKNPFMEVRAIKTPEDSLKALYWGVRSKHLGTAPLLPPIFEEVLFPINMDPHQDIGHQIKDSMEATNRLAEEIITADDEDFTLPLTKSEKIFLFISTFYSYLYPSASHFDEHKNLKEFTQFLSDLREKTEELIPNIDNPKFKTKTGSIQNRIGVLTRIAVFALEKASDPRTSIKIREQSIGLKVRLLELAYKACGKWWE